MIFLSYSGQAAPQQIQLIELNSD